MECKDLLIKMIKNEYELVPNCQDEETGSAIYSVDTENVTLAFWNSYNASFDCETALKLISIEILNGNNYGSVTVDSNNIRYDIIYK